MSRSKVVIKGNDGVQPWGCCWVTRNELLIVDGVVLPPPGQREEWEHEGDWNYAEHVCYCFDGTGVLIKSGST